MFRNPYIVIKATTPCEIYGTEWLFNPKNNVNVMVCTQRNSCSCYKLVYHHHRNAMKVEVTLKGLSMGWSYTINFMFLKKVMIDGKKIVRNGNVVTGPFKEVFHNNPLISCLLWSIKRKSFECIINPSRIIYLSCKYKPNS